jgi:hypothetical protein
VKLSSKYRNLVDLILTSKGLNRHKSLKASKRLGMKNLADKNVLWDEKSSRVKLLFEMKNLVGETSIQIQKSCRFDPYQ